jgi:hypothetical protein
MNDIRTPPATDAYRKNFDRIFKKEAPCFFNENPGMFIVKAIERSIKNNKKRRTHGQNQR